MKPETKKTKHQTTNPEPLIGAHESIAGGIYKAFERGESVGCRTLQVFTKNNTQWRAKPLTGEDITNYKTSQLESNISPVVAHSCYLINLCASNKETLRKSREAFIDELKRCEMLGIPYLNFHPGSHGGKGEEEGIKGIIESLNIAHEQTKGVRVSSILETTAGQGSAIGYRFEHLKKIIEGVDEPERMAVCIDTCHVFAAGYDISTDEGYEATITLFDEIIGLNRLVAFHANDSKKLLGSRVDRHEHIGKGAIGEAGFRCLMRDTRFVTIPKILETPKGEDLEEDRMNLETLRKLAGMQ
ncbi:MAG: deoxyribonuclease IV [Bacteroidetes bacterium]|nr:MAG: deoxyribonuclease IV [Bacteroidota bacterium]